MRPSVSARISTLVPLISIIFFCRDGGNRRLPRIFLGQNMRIAARE